MVAWIVELSKFDLKYETRIVIKDRVWANFIIKMVDKASMYEEKDLGPSFDSSSNL